MKKRIIHLILQLLIVGAFVHAVAQTATYNDVAVVINTNSAISESTGMYFVQARNIPPANIIRVAAPAIEEIDSLQFENLRSQVEQYIISNNLKDQINYIVTTKGMPLKVKRIASGGNSSVESELTLILGPYASNIGKDGRIWSPFYGKRNDFSRSKYGIYLVTRLDGYTLSDIKAMIDRAASIPAAIPSNARFVFDMDPTWSLTYSLNKNMQRAVDSLNRRGFVSIMDTTTVYLTHQTNVIGYTSWGSNDRNWQPYATNAIPKNTYLPGAIGETYVSTSARSFAPPPVYGQSLVADLVAEGITAVKGYVYEPYVSSMADVAMLYSMYADGYTVAECFYSSSGFLSWMDVVVGDPKFRLLRTRMPSDTWASQDSTNTNPLPVQLTSFTATAAKNSVQLAWHTATEVNNYGFDIERRTISNHQIAQSSIENWQKVGFVSGSGTSNSLHDYIFSDQFLSNGRYAYRIKQIDNDGSFTYYGNAEIVMSVTQKEFSLKGNYPNPFNPSTKIEFTVPTDGYTTLTVFNVIGQEVATLVNGMMKAGNLNTVQFDGSHLSSGMYYAQLTHDGHQLLQKMMLLK